MSIKEYIKSYFINDESESESESEEIDQDVIKFSIEIYQKYKIKLDDIKFEFEEAESILESRKKDLEKKYKKNKKKLENKEENEMILNILKKIRKVLK